MCKSPIWTKAREACHIDEYPIKLERNHDNLIPNDRVVRPHITRHWKEDGRTIAARDSFTRSSAKIWNQAPFTIKDANTLNLAKKINKNVLSNYQSNKPINDLEQRGPTNDLDEPITRTLNKSYKLKNNYKLKLILMTNLFKLNLVIC